MRFANVGVRSLWYALAVLLGSFAGCSCESEKASMVNPEAVHQSYSATYHAETNKTAVSARFRFGGATGTNLELDGLGKITNSSCEMKKDMTFGVHYVGECNGHQVDQVFEYVDTAGKIHKNSIKVVAIDYPADMPAEISRAKGIQLAFVGDAVANDEVVEISFSQSDKDGKSKSKAVQVRTVGAQAIGVTAGDLEPFTDGDATASLKRMRNHAPQSMTSRGGHMAATYVAKNRKVIFVK